jgi:putative transcriptional regulator
LLKLFQIFILIEKIKSMITKIAHYRNKLSITQEELAKIVDVTRQTIISLEQNRYNPSLLLAYKITKALGLKQIEDVFILE